MKSRLPVLLILGVLVFLGIMYKINSSSPKGGGPGFPRKQGTPEVAKAKPRPAVIFIVMDMIRADRLSLCGYDHPTSKHLDDLARRPGALQTCRAYSPGTWTLPSHASFFTGEEVPVHGADCLLEHEGKDSVSLWGDMVRPLTGNLPTLAEKMSKDYRTVLVSGNPVVSRWSATGLHRGFDVIRESRAFGDTYGIDLVASLEDALDEAGEEEPLFIFVNIADAHHPWRAVPDGKAWPRARPALDNRPRIPDNPYPRFLSGQMNEDERHEFLEHANDSYDWAVFRSDRTLGAVLRVLHARGITAGPHHLIVTSDHGEFLGEHDLLSHGIFVYEPDTRVPLVYVDSESREPQKVVEPISALSAFDLALTGRLPDNPRPVRAAGYPDGLMSKLFGEKLIATTAAHWDGHDKLFYKNGEFSIFDLEADPGELSPTPLPPDHPLRESFEKFVEQVIDTGRRTVEPTPEMIEALRQLGYMK